MSFASLQSPFSPGKKGFQVFPLPSVLPHDIDALKTLLRAQQNAHTALIETIRQEAHDYVIRMLEKAILARQRMFGASSERIRAQSRLFDESEVLTQTSTETQDVAPIAPIADQEAATDAPSDKSGVKPGRSKRVALATGLPNLMRDVLLDGFLIHMDETVVQELKEKDKAPTTNGYIWVQTVGPPDKPVVLYDYDPSRSASVPTALLEGYKGYLMTDGHDGYKEARADGIERLAFWAHVRRSFVEETRVQPKGKRGRADEAVILIGKLYRIESAHKDATSQVRYLARQSSSAPVLAELHAWMLKQTLMVIPKSALWTELAYMCNLWPQLTRYTEGGDFPIDNNRCENAIRPFVIGRKAWLSSDTPAAARSSAVTHSLSNLQGQRAGALYPAASGAA